MCPYFLNYGPSCVHIFSTMDLHVSIFFFFSILFHSPCLICKNYEESSCLNIWSIYLVEMEMHVLLTSSVEV
jgi:hypothetical protein